MVSPVSPFSFFPSSPLVNQPIAPPSGASAFSGNPAAVTSPLTSLLPSPTAQSAALAMNPLAFMLVSSPDTNPFVGTLSAPLNNNPPTLNTIVPQAVTSPPISSPNIQNNAQLQQSIAKIQQDTIGAQLLNATLAKGYTIRVGDTGSSGEEGVVVEGLTITNGRNGNEIIMNPNATDFDKTLVHELFHAATEDDGDSKLEEGVANIIGDLVSARINGRTPRNPIAILQETIPLYPELPLLN